MKILSHILSLLVTAASWSELRLDDLIWGGSQWGQRSFLFTPEVNRRSQTPLVFFVAPSQPLKWNSCFWSNLMLAHLFNMNWRKKIIISKHRQNQKRQKSQTGTKPDPENNVSENIMEHRSCNVPMNECSFFFFNTKCSLLLANTGICLYRITDVNQHRLDYDWWGCG